MELAFLSAVEQARLVRSGELSSAELVAALPRADRAARSDAERVRHGLRRRSARSGARSSTRRQATHRSAAFRSPSRTSRATAGIRTTYSSRAYADYVPDFDTRRRPPDPRGRLRDRRQDEHAGVRNGRVHRVGAQRRRPGTRGTPALTPGGSSGGAAAAARSRARAGRPRHRRRRLDPDPRVVLRPLRAQALARARLERAVRLIRGPLHRRAAHAHRRGRRPHPRRARRLRAGRSVVGAATRAAVRRDDRPSRLHASGSRSPRRRRSTSPVDPECVAAVTAAADAARRPRPRRARGDAPVARAEPVRHVHRGLAGRPGAPPGRRRLAADAAEPRARRGRAHDAPPPTTDARSRRCRSSRAGSSRSGATSTSCSRRRSRCRRFRSAGRRRSTGPIEQLLRNTEFTPFTAIANLTGLPAMSLPLHWSEGGLPIGVQAIGPPAGDALLLSLAAQIEAARPWADRRPPVSCSSGS